MEKGQLFIPSQRERSANGMPVQRHLKCALAPVPCPAQWCSTQITLTALSLSQHLLPAFPYNPPGLYRNGCTVSWKGQSYHWTQKQKYSGIPNVPPAQAAQVETGKAPKCLQQGTMHSNPSSSTAARWRPLVRLRPDLTSCTKTSAPQWTHLWWQHLVQRPSNSDFQDKKQLMFVWAAQLYGGIKAVGASAPLSVQGQGGTSFTWIWTREIATVPWSWSGISIWNWKNSWNGTCNNMGDLFPVSDLHLAELLLLRAADMRQQHSP